MSIEEIKKEVEKIKKEVEKIDAALSALLDVIDKITEEEHPANRIITSLTSKWHNIQKCIQTSRCHADILIKSNVVEVAFDAPYRIILAFNRDTNFNTINDAIVNELINTFANQIIETAKMLSEALSSIKVCKNTV